MERYILTNGFPHILPPETPDNRQNLKGDAYLSSQILDSRNLKNSLSLNIYATTFGMVFLTIVGNPIGSSTFTGFMRLLGAGDMTYSIVLALPVLGAVAQIFGSYALEKSGSRRLIFFTSGLISKLVWIPVALIPLMLGSNMRQASIWAITVLITVSSIGSAVNNIAFRSWIGSLVPSDIIGNFFSRRSFASTASGAVTALLMGLFIDRFDNLNGFVIIFIAGTLFGTLEILLYMGISHPPFEKCEETPTLKAIITEPLKNRNYFRFVLCATFFYFSTNIASPFYNIYMLDDLKMSYFQVNLSQKVTESLLMVLSVRFWGILTDRYGNRPVMLLGSFFTILVPLLWIFSWPHGIAMTYVASFFGGIGWAGFEMAVFNQSIWLAPEQNRSAYVACFTLFTCVIGNAVSYVFGGYFMQYVGPFIHNMRVPLIPGYVINSFCVLLLISFVFRIVAIVIFYPMYKEQGSKPAKVVVRALFQAVGDKIHAA